MRFNFGVKSVIILTIVNASMSFPNNFSLRQLRVNLKIVKRNTSKNIINRVRVVSENHEDILDKSVSIFYDNMLTDMLSLAKLYNLISDNNKSYYYIICYEFLWFGFKVLKKNSSNDIMTNDTEKAQILFDQLIINIVLYVSIKNIIFKNVITILGTIPQ